MRLMGAAVASGSLFLLLSQDGVAAKKAVEPAPPAVDPAVYEQALAAALRSVNGAIYGGRGADLLPLQATPVQLRSTEIVLSQAPGKDGWQISAAYELFNAAAGAVPLSLLFPEELCQPQGGRDCSPMRGAFLDTGTRVGDKLIEPGRASAQAVHPFATTPGKGYLYELSVPGKRPVRLVHEYRLDESKGREWWGLHYLSSAGRWGGPVGPLRFVVELRRPMPYVVYPRLFQLRSFTEQPNPNGQGTTTRLVFTAERIASRSDFLVAFPSDIVAGASPSGFCFGFRGQLSDEELVRNVRGYDMARLHGCRDHVLSLHGYSFPDQAVRARYYGSPPRLPAWADERAFAIAVHPESSGFSENQLSSGEQAYLKALAAAARPQTH